MALCWKTGTETELVEGPRQGVLRCPVCGVLMDAETLLDVGA